MPSWVRYGVAVYVGLLMAGTLGSFWPDASANFKEPGEVRSLRPAQVQPVLDDLLTRDDHPCRESLLHSPTPIDTVRQPHRPRSDSQG